MVEEEDGEILLRKQGWFLGELSEDSATEILQNCQEYNVFIVYCTPSQKYILSARFPIEDTDNGLIEHIEILENENKRYQLSGQSDSYDTVVDAVNSYTMLREPPLTPALGAAGGNNHRTLDLQLSVSSVPPAYDEANRKLQPDIAPLPKIDNIQPELAVEAKTGQISPTGSLRINHFNSDWRTSTPPPFMNNSHWWRYRDKFCCHPKNVCHCCCYRATHWNGYREVNEHKWFDCRGTGFCRCLLLILMWFLIWPCVGVGLCIFGCFILCYFACCYEDDD